MLLEACGEDPDRPGLADTPRRMAKMYAELLAGMDARAEEHLRTRFPMEEGGMVVERDIPFYSLCEHHMLPFFGKAHIAYLPGEGVAGLSKLARTVEVFARRLQLQEQLTAQIADALMEHLGAKGVMVALEAEHLCMTMRGVKKPGSTTVTFAKRGLFDRDAWYQEAFLASMRGLGRG